MSFPAAGILPKGHRALQLGWRDSAVLQLLPKLSSKGTSPSLSLILPAELCESPQQPGGISPLPLPHSSQDAESSGLVQGTLGCTSASLCLFWLHCRISWDPPPRHTPPAGYPCTRLRMRPSQLSPLCVTTGTEKAWKRHSDRGQPQRGKGRDSQHQRSRALKQKRVKHKQNIRAKCS